MTFWTDDRVEKLKALWADGMSASIIGGQLGCTRNAVISKLHRLDVNGSRKRPRRTRNTAKLPLRPSMTEHSNGKHLNSKIKELHRLHVEMAAVVPPAPPLAPEAFEAGGFSVGVQLLDALPHHCRWPLGDPTSPEFRFCGANKITGSSYCEHHSGLAWVAPRKSKHFSLRRAA